MGPRLVLLVELGSVWRLLSAVRSSYRHVGTFYTHSRVADHRWLTPAAVLRCVPAGGREHGAQLLLDDLLGLDPVVLQLRRQSAACTQHRYKQCRADCYGIPCGSRGTAEYDGS